MAGLFHRRKRNHVGPRPIVLIGWPGAETKSMNVAQISLQVRPYVGALLLVSLLLGPGAASAQTQSPAPKKPNGYLPVEDVPKREDPAMSPGDRANLVKELTAARDRQAPHKAKGATKPAKP
jgi:hypothetical protein